MGEYQFIVYIIAIISAALQLIFIFGIYSRVAFHRKKTIEYSSYPPVSIVIAARNEHHNLLHNLKSILEQDYPDFEVVVVNDQSNDDSEYFLKTLQATYKHLSIVNVTNPIVFFKGKKFPLSIGIKSAKNNVLLLTDADCNPASDQWLREISDCYKSNKTEIVLGYGAYAEKKGLLNLLIRFETLRTAIQYFAFAKMGMAYMGVGRNLSYTKELFFQQQGFQSHYKIQSGDDDLFVNKAANNHNVEVLISPSAKTISAPKTSFTSWINQKRRHLTTGKEYKISHILILSIIEISFILFIASHIFLLITQYQVIVILILLTIRYLAFLLIIKKSMTKLGEQKLLLISPLMEILLAVLIPIISITNIFYRKRKWK
jgi:cellulose synthase/poly-beta-1,6-N-acetylglucosamine synthase-like glycosyltransferase